MNKCDLCSKESSEFFKTLYGNTICNQCHDLLKKHNVKKDLGNLDERIKEYADHYYKIAPDRIKRNQYRYIRGSFRTYCIPLHITDGYAKEIPTSKTEQEIKKKYLFMRVVSFFAPKVFRGLLDKETRKKIDAEIKENVKEIRQLQESRKKAEEENKKTKIEQYVKNRMAQIYPKQYLFIIETARKAKILLYEYYLDEYPPDWEYRAEAVKERDKNKCQKCGSVQDLCVHHKIPVKKTFGNVFFSTSYQSFEKKLERERLRKGDHFIDNLITLCKGCHIKEHPSLEKKIRQKY